MQGAGRRRCGDIVEERQRRRYAPWPPRPAGLRLPRPANHCGLPVMIQLGMGAAAKCQIILARALSSTNSTKEIRGIRAVRGRAFLGLLHLSLEPLVPLPLGPL